MSEVFIVRDQSPSGVFAVYDNRGAAEAVMRSLGVDPSNPPVELGVWIVASTVLDAFDSGWVKPTPARARGGVIVSAGRQ